MEIRIWRSFSCNNSSSYRLVARFEDAELARATAEQLTAFLAEATPLTQARQRTRSGSLRTPLTTATSFPVTAEMDALAIQYGFDWTGLLVSGVYGDDELVVMSEGATLLIYHPYCLGLGSELPVYLRARGGSVGSQAASDPAVSVLFRLPNPSARTEKHESLEKLKVELRQLFAQTDEATDTRGRAVTPPWALGGERLFVSPTATAFFCDDKQLGFYVAIDPTQLPLLKEYLREAGVEDASIRLCEESDLPRFRAIAKARCSHCDGRLEYLAKDDHQIATDQLACGQCGGMFELDAFL